MNAGQTRGGKITELGNPSKGFVGTPGIHECLDRSEHHRRKVKMVYTEDKWVKTAWSWARDYTWGRKEGIESNY